jgi:two-component system, OmpR family, phosphate regulon sensor histidine kinase PhoR
VQVEAIEKEVYIQIKDHGIGIPAKDLEKIFTRFYTVNKAHCRKLGGAGLGLSIVKLIIEKHGGRIHATSSLGHCSTLHLYLPLQKNASLEAQGL